jgi:hypothetical protein
VRYILTPPYVFIYSYLIEQGRLVGRWVKLLLAFASTVIPCSGAGGTHDHIFLSHESHRVMRLSPTEHRYSCTSIYFREIRRETVDWIQLAQDKIHGRTFVNIVR